MEEEAVVGAEAVVEEASREDEAMEEMVREGITIQTEGKVKDRT